MASDWYREAEQLWHRGNIARAVRMYEKIAKSDPYDGLALLWAAVGSFLLGNQEKGILFLRKIQKINPFDLSIREIAEKVGMLATGELCFIRLRHVIGICEASEEMEYRARLEEVEGCFDLILQFAGGQSLRDVIWCEVTRDFLPISRGDVFFRPILPKVEIALNSWSKGTIIHELSHVLYPSFHLFLNEGLALYFQERLGGEDRGWPFTEKDFDNICVEKNLVDEVMQDSLIMARFFTLENILSGKAMDFYKLAWQWVKYMIEQGGQERFLAFYENVALMQEVSLDVFVRFYGVRNWWLERENKATGENFSTLDERGISWEEREEVILNLKDEWEKTQQKEILAQLCRDGVALVNELRGMTYNQGKDHPLFEKYSFYLGLVDGWLQKALVIWPNNAVLHCMRADVLGMEIENAPEQQKTSLALLMQAEAKKALALDPDSPDVLVTMGRILLFTPKIFGGGIRPARGYISLALERNPSHAEAMAWDGYIDYLEGKKEEAIKKWERVLETHPHHLLSLHMLNKVHS